MPPKKNRKAEARFNGGSGQDEEKRGRGRPLAPIDPRRLEAAASTMLPINDIARVLGVGDATLERRMANDPELRAAYERGRSNRRATLSQLQWKSASEGNVTMLIWLGKQHLSQRDFRDENRGVDAERLANAIRSAFEAVQDSVSPPPPAPPAAQAA